MITTFIQVDSVEVPAAGVALDAPKGWTVDARAQGAAIVLRGGDGIALAITAEDLDPATAATRLRDQLGTLVREFQVLDDDALPLGGRSWRRIRMRFIVSGNAFDQAAFCGSVGGKTITAVLSGPTSSFDRHWQECTAAITSLRPYAAW